MENARNSGHDWTKVWTWFHEGLNMAEFLDINTPWAHENIPFFKNVVSIVLAQERYAEIVAFHFLPCFGQFFIYVYVTKSVYIQIITLKSL